METSVDHAIRLVREQYAKHPDIEEYATWGTEMLAAWPGSIVVQAKILADEVERLRALQAQRPLP